MPPAIEPLPRDLALVPWTRRVSVDVLPTPAPRPPCPEATAFVRRIAREIAAAYSLMLEEVAPPRGPA